MILSSTDVCEVSLLHHQGNHRVVKRFARLSDMHNYMAAGEMVPNGILVFPKRMRVVLNGTECTVEEENVGPDLGNFFWTDSMDASHWIWATGTSTYSPVHRSCSR